VTDARKRARRDEGAVLVEFAIILPVLFLVLFAIVEFGWGFAQYLDVRHGAREGARLAAVDYSSESPASSGATQRQEIFDAVCERMGGDAIGAELTLTLVDDAETDIGDNASIEVNSDLDTLTGFLDFALGDVLIDDDISFRLERDVSWTDNGSDGPYTCPP
jgi:Flp pilus assembly protein TadG